MMEINHVGCPASELSSYACTNVDEKRQSPGACA